MSLLPAHSVRVMDPIPAATVFFVEDEECLRQLMRHALRAAGYDTLEAINGEAAIQRIAECRGSIDLVVAEFVAVRETRFQTRLSRLRPGIPLLLCSGLSREDVLANEVFDPSIPILEKPFRLADFIRLVDELLEIRRLDGEQSR